MTPLPVTSLLGMTPVALANLMVWAGTLALAVVVVFRIRQGVWRQVDADNNAALPPKPPSWVMALALVGVVAALGGVAILMRS